MRSNPLAPCVDNEQHYAMQSGLNGAAWALMKSQIFGKHGSWDGGGEIGAKLLWRAAQILDFQ